MAKYLKYLPLAAFFIPTLVSAQTFPKPPDVPDYVPIAATYASGTTLNVLGDNSTTWGGTAPYIASMPADIPTTEFPTGWIVSSGISQCTTVPVTCPEAKFRTAINGSHILYDDPIRNYGLPGTSHCHEFFGNKGANAYSTYARLRTKRASTAGGGPYNGTAYWAPCAVLTNPFSDGKNYAVKIDWVVIYYTTNPGSLNIYTSRIPRGLRYILGTNMDDPDDLIVKAEIAAANAQPGTAGRYVYTGNGYNGWHCTTTTTNSSKWLKNSDNTDPFSPTCPAGAQNFYVEFVAPSCWDGVNPWSPGGYKHMRQTVYDNVAGRNVCPNGWYQLPELQGKLYHTLGAWPNYGNVRLSSDDAAATAAGHAIRNGESFHTDWFGAWDDTTFMAWQNYCSGIMNQTAHQCDYSTISATQRLITDSAAPDGSRNPQVDVNASYGVGSAGVMYQLPSQSNGPAVINQHQ